MATLEVELVKKLEHNIKHLPDKNKNKIKIIRSKVIDKSRYTLLRFWDEEQFPCSISGRQAAWEYIGDLVAQSGIENIEDPEVVSYLANNVFRSRYTVYSHGKQIFETKFRKCSTLLSSILKFGHRAVVISKY